MTSAWVKARDKRHLPMSVRRFRPAAVCSDNFGDFDIPGAERCETTVP